jgi:hypothetical protein
MKSGNWFVSFCQVIDNKLGRRSKQAQERGAIIPTMALGLVVFLAIGSLAIDISHQMTAGVELQNAADAAMRAGIVELDQTADGISRAITQALSVGNTFEWGTSLNLTRNDVTFAASPSEFVENGGLGRNEAAARNNPGPIAYMRVKIPLRHIKGVFTKVSIGRTYLAVTREAVGARFPNGLIPAPADSPAGTPPTLTDASTVNTLCEWVPLSALQDPVNFVPLNQPNGGTCGNPYKFSPGCTYVIRAGSNGNGTGFVAGGNFQALAALNPDGSRMDTGGSDLRQRIAGKMTVCIHPGDWIGTEPGENSGTVRQGLNSRFGDYGGGLSSSAYPPDVNVKEGITYDEYLTATPNSNKFQAPNQGVGKARRRVIVIPIINNNEFNAGRDQVRLYDLGAFFLRSKVNNGSNADITAEYIGRGYVAPGAKYTPNLPPPTNGARSRGLTLTSIVK